MSDEQGWQRPHRASRAHYFINGESLCGRHHRRAYLGLYDDGSQRCSACFDKLHALIQSGKVSAWSLVQRIGPTGTVRGQ